ncbi:MAG TPA: hypothetical protein PLZ99_02385 [Parcubacteria group bacterium]|jgi:hypothetical protein|nr:hypothetical protein [Parcubacteria group bacterium]
MSDDEIKDLDGFGDESGGGPSDDVLKKGKVGDDDIFGDDLADGISDGLVVDEIGMEDEFDSLDKLADEELDDELDMEEEDAW